MRLPRVRFTVRRMVVAVAILGTGMGLVARLARVSGMPPARLTAVLVALTLVSLALNGIAFSLLWLFKRAARTMAHRKPVKSEAW